jgi:hypothetical protein
MEKQGEMVVVAAVDKNGSIQYTTDRLGHDVLRTPDT